MVATSRSFITNLFIALVILGGSQLALAQTTGDITTFAGGSLGFAGDGGPAIQAKFSGPGGLAMDHAGNVYIADVGNQRVRKVDTSGNINTVAGTGDAGFTGDGGPAINASFSWPFNGHVGIAVDGKGNLYIPDYNNQRIRMVDTSGNINTVAGNGNRDNTGDGGPALNAGLVDPISVAVDGAGNLYIAEFSGNRVRKVDTSGTITTFAGGHLFLNGNGDGGQASLAELNAPEALALDSAGNVYIGDVTARRVRKVDTSGIITTLAGDGSANSSGDGGPATMAGMYPVGLAADSAGSVFIADAYNNRVREVKSGIISTVAGTGQGGSSGDRGPATSATLNDAEDVAVDSAGNLYIAEFMGMRVREVFGIAASPKPAVSPGGVVSASAFGEFTSVSPGSWIEIYGSNLAVGTQSWAASDFNGVNAPTSLNGTSVTIGGQAAFIGFISPGQVNALVPSNIATGMLSMTVTVGSLTSAAYNINVNPVQPGFDAPPSFNIGGIQYVVALFADGTYVLPVGAIAGLPSRPAQPGDEIVLYGIGFGPVTPNIPAGQLVQEANQMESAFSMSIGGAPVTNLPYSGLAPSYTGLYQFNMVVPANPGSGAVPLTFTVGGVAGTQTLYLAMSN
jgi:uncharacterized protein (TIGR03437 family)